MVFSLFQKPKLLITSVEKVNLEGEVLRLSEFYDLFKDDRFEWVQPAEYVSGLDSSSESIEELFEALRARLDIDSNRVRLHFSVEETNAVSGMLLTHSLDSAFDPDSKQLKSEFKSDIVVGTNVVYSAVPAELIRILVTEKLILDGFADVDSVDLAFSAEVATALLGFGLFTVNETVGCNQVTSAMTSYFSIKKLGAINSFGIGFLLALIGWKRGKPDRTIGSLLRPDAALSYKKSLAYLEKTNDSLLSDHNLLRLESNSSISALDAYLKNDSASTLIWVMRLIESRAELSRDIGQIKPTLFPLLDHKDQFVNQLALHLISFAEKLDEEESIRLAKVTQSKDEWSNAVAANVLSRHLPFDQLETDFSRLLQRSDHSAAANVAQIANRYGTDASKFSDAVCDRIRVALNRCDFFLGKWYVLILMSISENARQHVEHFFVDDEDLYRGAIELIDDAVDVTEINPNDAKPTPSEIKDEFVVPAWINI